MDAFMACLQTTTGANYFRPRACRNLCYCKTYSVITCFIRQPANILVHLYPSMHRLAAHFALAAIYVGVFSPLLASQQSSLHDCCRRTGLHHCQTTNDAGLRSKTNACPYSTPLSSGAISALGPATFRISSPTNLDVLIHASSVFHLVNAAHDLSARAPPIN